MLYGIGASAVLVLHLAFILFVLFGGIAVAWRRWVLWIHLPVFGWGVYVELTGTGCPLTYVENELRARAGLAGYQGDFVEHYLLRLIYPNGLTPDTQVALAIIVLFVNALAYGWVAWRWRKRRHRAEARTIGQASH